MKKGADGWKEIAISKGLPFLLPEWTFQKSLVGVLEIVHVNSSHSKKSVLKLLLEIASSGM